MAADLGVDLGAAAGEVIELGDLTALTAGGEDDSTENKREPYD